MLSQTVFSLSVTVYPWTLDSCNVTERQIP